jgi:hypothetical protein
VCLCLPFRVCSAEFSSPVSVERSPEEKSALRRAEESYRAGKERVVLLVVMTAPGADCVDIVGKDGIINGIGGTTEVGPS